MKHKCFFFSYHRLSSACFSMVSGELWWLSLCLDAWVTYMCVRTCERLVICWCSTTKAAQTCLPGMLLSSRSFHHYETTQLIPDCVTLWLITWCIEMTLMRICWFKISSLFFIFFFFSSLSLPLFSTFASLYLWFMSPWFQIRWAGVETPCQRSENLNKEQASRYFQHRVHIVFLLDC